LKPITIASPSWENLHRILLIVLFIISGTFFPGNAQKKITFPAVDSLRVTADFYKGDSAAPFLLLFHEEGSSRGEFREIAPRLVKMGYNCLAVDLRKGRESNYVSNETARRAAALSPPPKAYDCLKDIRGAVRYASGISGKPVVLLGSSFSASLCLLDAAKDSMVSAVAAFSPGEFFRPFLTVRDSLQAITVPVFIAGSKQEYPYLTELSSKIPPAHVTIFVPTRHNGKHGTSSLLSSDPASGDYWLSLLMFFRNIRNRK